MKLLTTNNTKTEKGNKKGYLTGIMHLAPARLSGFNVCPMASAGCAAACLNTAGRGVYQHTQDSRIRKTLLFFNDRDTFMKLLVDDINAIVRKAAREGTIPAIRLNGTSDIQWETVKVKHAGKEYKNIMALFPLIQFYDYTKIASRFTKVLPANYHLTFSRSESNTAESLNVLDKGHNVAVVFSTKAGNTLPPSWHNHTVYSGDDTDLRFLDPKGAVIGLTAKGKGRKDTSGFVVKV